MRLIALAAAATVLFQPLATDVGPPPGATYPKPASHPHIEVHAKPVPEVSQISASVTLHVYAVPKAWDLNVSLWKWEHVTTATGKREWRWVIQPGQGHWDKADLPHVGHNQYFYHEWNCAPGIYTTLWVMSGRGSDDKPGRTYVYWPFLNWNSKVRKDWNPLRTPTTKQAFHIYSSGDYGCEHNHGN